MTLSFNVCWEWRE